MLPDREDQREDLEFPGTKSAPEGSGQRMAQRTQQQSLQGTAGVSLAGESKRAKKAGKEDAKLKADPRGQTEKNREEADNHAKEARSTREADNHAKEARSTRKAENHAKEARSTRKADNHAKEARSKEEAENHAKETRSTRRAGSIAQEGLYTHTSRADSNRSNNSPRTGERSCVTAQDKRRKRIHADPVPDMDPDPDPDPGQRRHLTDTQRDGNEGMVIALRGLQTSLTAMSGGSAKNGGFPQFDGTSIGYLRFRQRWKTFQ